MSKNKVKTFENYTPFEQCPYCKSKNVENLATFKDDDALVVALICTNCNRRWWENYTFTHSDLILSDYVSQRH